MISEAMRAANRQLHKNPYYGARGQRWTVVVADLMDRCGCQSALDYGCGKGGLKSAMPDRDIREYDPAIEGKDGRPAPADIVLCGDVLEHVEPDWIDRVLADIKSLARKFVILHVATHPAKKTLPDGRNAHLIVQPPAWWRDKFAAHFDTIAEREKPTALTVIGRPKQEKSA